jgi:hypothetical protein
MFNSKDDKMPYEFTAKELENEYSRKVQKLKLHLHCKDNRELLKKLVDEKNKEILSSFSSCS